MKLKKFEENRKLIDRIKEICDEKEIQTLKTKN